MLKDRLGKELLYLDGGTGTLLQERGLKPGQLPETWNMERTEDLIGIHQQYFEAGSDIVLTNTFGANALKFHDERYELPAIIEAAVANVKEAARRGVGGGREVYTALDIGPTGRLLEPMGDLEFEEAYNAFQETAVAGERAGADLIHIETMSDTYEVKAAVLAAKENTDLPVFATMIFDENGKLLTGADVPSVVALLEGLRVDALGINCGLGPAKMLPILDEIMEYASVPVIVKPNAGLPRQVKGQTVYDVNPKEFAGYMEEIVLRGACLIGGCCGTTPDYIRGMIQRTKSTRAFSRRVELQTKNRTIISSYGTSVTLGDKPIIIGERINPTGKRKFKQALRDHDIDYILKEGILQQDAGAHILDVNVGIPEIDEPAMMGEAIRELQSVISLPLQIDSANPMALERAMRVYNGKPMVNSVNGKQESMDAVFPLIAKYGGVVVALTLDENGIPKDAAGRILIAEKIIKEAKKYGIERKDIVVDVLTMTISSEPEGAKIALEALGEIREKFGVCSILGVSNISFGLPNRSAINAGFYTMALSHGLNAAIVNPLNAEMMRAYYASAALLGYDENCQDYIAACTEETEPIPIAASGGITLREAIEKGLKEEAHHAAQKMVKNRDPLSIINEDMIPALDEVGRGFENKTVFLPQLLMSADAAKQAFAVLRDEIAKNGGRGEKREKIILATVKGDIHDIGKNIVKALLENYSFDVLDLGKDVDPEKIVRTAVEWGVVLVGLSALMTTTVGSMEETIRLLKKTKPECKVMVGGAVLTQEYADMIGADFYAKDAIQSVHYAQEIFEGV